MPEQNEIERVETYEGPPEAFGLQWDAGKIVHTRRGERRLAKAAVTLEFEAAWGVAFEELDKAGYSWDGPARVMFWERLGLDQTALRELVDSLPDRVAKAQAETLRIQEERAEREAAAEASRRVEEARWINAAKEVARRSLQARRWSWAKGSLIDEAQELIARPHLDRAGADRLIVLVDQAAKNVARSEKRTAAPHESEMDRAQDPDVRQAAHAACRAITAYDADWASIRNDVGWSRSTTCDGHVLAGLDSLNVEQASHALRLLRVHHRQIPEALRGGLFPTAQPALSLSPAA